MIERSEQERGRGGRGRKIRIKNGGLVRGITFVIGGGKILYRSEGLQVVPARPSSKGTVEARYNWK